MLLEGARRALEQVVRASEGTDVLAFVDNLVSDGADPKAVMQEVLKACRKVEPDCEIFM